MAQYRLIPVLKQMPNPIMPAVEIHRIPGHQPPHKFREGGLSPENEQMEMVGKEADRQTFTTRFL
jgi:hypothetical protein